MSELAKIVKKKYDDFDITPRQLRNVIRDNNITRKRTRHEHFPVMRYGTPIEKQKELDKFYKKVDEYKLNKIISLDETSIKPAMLKEYSRCKLGKRCVVKTDDSYIFRKFTLLVAIKNSKCVGWKLYEIGKDLFKEINTNSKCDNCNYEITLNREYKQCKVCHSVSKLNYLEKCYGLNYEEKIKRSKKTHERMNNKRIGINGKIF